ncbi:MAG: hypothetical protein HC781_18245 [Leptolyngbyaceae cyanobacterium CSU_1_4]|nr:hypothetical protein [Leptolyngbyaceae cyanobacterium CSU_1_4]
MAELFGHSRHILLEKVDFEMDQSQRELRRAANQAFMESLNHLGMSLPSGDTELAIPVEPPKPALPIDLEDLEAAAADIEAYMQIKTGIETVPTNESPEST